MQGHMQVGMCMQGHMQVGICMQGTCRWTCMQGHRQVDIGMQGHRQVDISTQRQRQGDICMQWHRQVPHSQAVTCIQQECSTTGSSKPWISNSDRGAYACSHLSKQMPPGRGAYACSLGRRAYV